MSIAKDHSTALARINDLLAANGPLETTDSPVLSEELGNAVAAIQKTLFPEMQLKPIEILVISRVFVLEEGSHVASNLIFEKFFTSDVGMREQLRLLRKLHEKGILESPFESVRIKDWRRPKPERDYALTKMYGGPMHLTEYAFANIIGDEEKMYKGRQQGFENNLEFLESWSSLVDALRIGRERLGLYEGNMGSYASELCDVQERYDRIQKRLALTTEEIPFRTLCSEYDLSCAEQLVIMYDVYHYGDRDFASELRNSAVLLPADSPSFLSRDVFDKDSRLVEKQIYRPLKIDSDGKAEYKYKLATQYYIFILGDSALKVGHPILP